MRWGARTSIVLPSCSCDDETSTPAVTAPIVLQWDEPEHLYRVTVTLNPHPDRARADVPVLAAFEHAGAFIDLQ